MASSLTDQRGIFALSLPMKIKSLVYVVIKSVKYGTLYLSQYPLFISVLQMHYNGVSQDKINNHPYHPSPHLKDEK